jgi:hypothetical protein
LTAHGAAFQGNVTCEPYPDCAPGQDAEWNETADSMRKLGWIISVIIGIPLAAILVTCLVFCCVGGLGGGAYWCDSESCLEASLGGGALCYTCAMCGCGYAFAPSAAAAYYTMRCSRTLKSAWLLLIAHGSCGVCGGAVAMVVFTIKLTVNYFVSGHCLDLPSPALFGILCHC